jgi:hypothetical protein
MSQYRAQWSQLLTYCGSRSLPRRIRRVYNCIPLRLLGKGSVTTLGGLCRVHIDPSKRPSSNQAGRQWRLELSLKPVRINRSCCKRFTAGLESTSFCIRGAAKSTSRTGGRGLGDSHFTLVGVSSWDLLTVFFALDRGGVVSLSWGGVR